MTRGSNILTLVNVLLGLFSTIYAECRFGPYDLSPLDGVPWIVQDGNSTKTTYKISLCKELNAPIERECQEHSSVCRYIGEDNVRSVGNHSTSTNVTFNEEKAELWLVLKGAPCEDSPANFYKTIFNFKCGKTLGSPKLLETYACDTYFEWHTSAACKDTPTVDEVRCSVYDHHGNKRDLTPLIKTSGGYLVDSAGDRDFYINVCREITQDARTSACPSGSATCEVRSSSEVLDRGRPSSHLMVTSDGKLYLQYRSNKTPQGCEGPSTTTITFICPKRGGGRDPLLTSDLGCNYGIEWQTEYACPEVHLVSHTCTLTENQHYIDIDLTPLTKITHASHKYKVTVPVLGQNDYEYFLNICEDVGVPCPNVQENVAVCQLQGEQGHVLGRPTDQTLRYSDGELTLTYKHGDKCSSHFHRETVINFHCDRKAAADGMGWPEFNKEDQCTYIFDWNTTYACLNHALPTQCNVKHGSNRYDLSPLIKGTQSNWEALRGSHIEGDTDDDRYFLDVCHQVSAIGGATGCPDHAAVCLRDKDGKFKNLGEYKDSPVYDPVSHHLQLHYTDGGDCGDNKKHETFIKLRCKPGDLESGPDLVGKSHDGCVYEFVWETAAACALGVTEGSDCSVVDSDAGYSLDLSVLEKSGDQAYYKVTTNTSNYDYYINVCGKATGSPCDTAGNKNVGVCQVSKAEPSRAVSTGEASRHLHYYNGMVNLTYTNGSMYRSTPPRPRTTQIAFICDRDAGQGRPEFVQEANYTYSFLWLTAHVCPQKLVECMVTDSSTGQQYDLSQLALSADRGNWNVAADDPANSKFIINVCRSVNPVSMATGCQPTASACMTEYIEGQGEKLLHPNLGEVRTGPTIEAEGQLLLTYDNGGTCIKSDGTSVNYTTKIHLRCQPGEMNSAPRLGSGEDCEYVFLWETSKACPLGGPSGGTTNTSRAGECTIRDINSDFVFDLSPLRRTDSQVVYSVSNGNGRTFKLNICGGVSIVGCDPVDGKPSAVCEDGQSLAAVNSQLTIGETGRVSLTYPGLRLDNGEKSDVIILFECYKDAVEGPITVTREGEDTLEITFQTALVCGPQPVDCLTTDSTGRQYDLSTLARTDGNWEVVDPRTGHSDLKYFINVCHPLNVVPGSICPGGAVGGCQVDGSGKAYNLGYIQSKPIPGEDGSLSIRYLGGDLCHKGRPNQNHRSVRILFECSDTQHPPLLQSETTDCEYIFSWQTPSACPLKTVVGEDCKVTEPLYHMTFDVSRLQKVGDHDYTVTTGDYRYSLNVCGPLNNGSGECEGAGACQTRTQADGTVVHVDTGKSSRKLKYNDGELSLTYEDGRAQCHGKFNRTTVINFVCDHSKYGTAGPTFINETTQCTYLFEWATHFACMPFTMSDCTIKGDDGHQYDLSPLTLTNHNYVYDGNKRKYLINVCTTIVHQPGVTCPPNSAACYIDTEETDPQKKAVKLGEPLGRSLEFDEEKNIKLTYSNGQNCSKPSMKHKTIIIFVCKAEAIDSSPHLLYAEDDCIFTFMWETRVACNIPEISESTSNCTVKNPTTGYTYNLGSLSRPEGYSIEDEHGHKLHINICAPLTTTDCSGHVGSCQSETGGESRHWNAGQSNGDLHYTDGDLYLNYSGGDPCHHNNRTRNTIINFVCGSAGSGVGHPVYVDEDEDCNYYVSWHTELACERHVACEAEDDHGHVLDLSPLIRGSGNHLALSTAAGTQPGAVFYINVCRPLTPIHGTLCPPQAAACKVIGKKVQSLGRVSEAPFFDRYSRNVISVYDHGSPCEKNNGKTNASSRITFVCKPGPLGQPRLEMVTDDCMYEFEWETSAVCIDTEPVTSQDCHFTDSKTAHLYDLTALKKQSSAYKVSSRVGTFYLNLCDRVSDADLPTSGCGGSAVCLLDSSGQATSYGTPTTQTIWMEGSAIKVAYTGGKTCGDGKAESYFLVECKEDMEGIGTPTIFSMSADGCQVVFRWLTPLACKPVVKDCTVAGGGSVYDLQILTRDHSLWTVNDTAGNTYFINICAGLHGDVKSPDCPPHSAVCRKNEFGTVDMLGMVHSQRLSVSADGSVILEYSQGSNQACAQRRRKRGEEEAATVKIKFTCGDTVGYPQYVPRKGDLDSCVFEFKWKSRVACKEERIPVTDNQGILIDPRSGGLMKLDKLEDGLDVLLHGPDNRYVYSINLHGTVSPTTTGEACHNASICKTRLGTKTSVNLGSRASRKFYMEDDIVEAEFTSNTACATDPQRKTSSVIAFHCVLSPQNNKTTPVFRDSSRSCVYLFDWYTKHACVHDSIHVPGSEGDTVDESPMSSFPSSSTSHHNRVGAAIGISVLVIFILTLVGVFYKPSRRRAFRYGVTRIFQRGAAGRLIKYSTLSSLDEDESLIPDNSSSSLVEHQPRLPTLTSDESDEDLIL